MYVIWWFANLTKFRIFVIVYFQLLKTSLKMRKREFDWSMFFVGPIRDLFSQLKKRKEIFVLQNLKFCQISKITGWHTNDIGVAFWGGLPYIRFEEIFSNNRQCRTESSFSLVFFYNICPGILPRLVQTKSVLLRDHPFKTLAFSRRGGVKNWSNLPTDSSKKLPAVGGRDQK